MDQRLVYDVGANNGEDTAHYLSKGYRVVAIEANPDLAAVLSRRFAGQPVEVLNVGISEHAGRFTFYVNESNDDHSAFDEKVGTRGGRYHAVEVEGVPLDKILSDHGVPFYLKVDIERADGACLAALSSADLPRYVSIEAHELGYLARLYELGYRRFKVVDQAGINRPRFYNNERPWGRGAWYLEWQARRFRNHYGGPQRYELGSSGPFGDDTPGPWLDFEAVAYEWLHFHTGRRNRGHINHRGWFDFHASL